MILVGTFQLRIFYNSIVFPMESCSLSLLILLRVASAAVKETDLEGKNGRMETSASLTF